MKPPFEDWYVTFRFLGHRVIRNDTDGNESDSHAMTFGVGPFQCYAVAHAWSVSLSARSHRKYGPAINRPVRLIDVVEQGISDRNMIRPEAFVIEMVWEQDSDWKGRLWIA